MRETLHNTRLDPQERQFAITKTAVDALKYPSIRQQFGTVVRNNYLSALSTFIKNLAGNTARMIELPLARLARGQVFEAGLMLKGYSQALFKAFPRFVEGFSNPYIEFDGKTGQRWGVYLGNPGKDPSKTLETANRTLNGIATFPQSLQRGTDEVFANFFERAQFEVLLERAKSKLPDEYFTRLGMNRNEYIDRIEKMASDHSPKTTLWRHLEDFDPALAQEIESFSRYGTFRSKLGDSLIDQGTKQLVKFVDKVPEFSLVLPFITTPTNIAKFGAGYVPGIGLLRVRQGMKDIKNLNNLIIEKTEKLKTLNPESKTYDNLKKDIIKLDGEIKFKQDLNKDFFAQQILGTALIASTYSMVESNQLTGNYPSDPAKRKAMMQNKIPPLSIRVGDRWVGYNGIEPLHTILSLTVDSMSFVKDQKLLKRWEEGRLSEVEFGRAFADTIKNAFLDKTFTKQLADVLQAIQEPNSAERLIISATNGLTPNILNQIARIQDPIIRETRDPELSTWIINNLKARTPGLRETLPIRPNITGEPYSLGSTAEIATGFINREAEQTERQSFFNNPKLKIQDPSRNLYGVELTADQYNRMATQMGQLTGIVVDAFASNPGYQKLPDTYKAFLFKGVVEKIRRNVRLSMLPELALDPVQKMLYIRQEFMKKGIDLDEWDKNIE